MPFLIIEKDFREAAKAMAERMEDVTTTERQDTSRGAAQDEVVVEGDFHVFSMYLMDTWGGRCRFIFRDVKPKADDEELESARSLLARSVPALAHQLYSPTQLRVEKERTVTIQVIKKVGYKVISDETTTETEWEDVTEQFAKIAQHEHAFFAK